MANQKTYKEYFKEKFIDEIQIGFKIREIKTNLIKLRRNNNEYIKRIRNRKNMCWRGA